MSEHVIVENGSYRTRDGRKVEHVRYKPLEHQAHAQGYVVDAVITERDGTTIVHSYTATGRFHIHSNNSPLDLVPFEQEKFIEVAVGDYNAKSAQICDLRSQRDALREEVKLLKDQAGAMNLAYETQVSKIKRLSERNKAQEVHLEQDKDLIRLLQRSVREWNADPYVLFARRKLRDDHGVVPGLLSDREAFICLNGLYYQTSYITSVPGLRRDQLVFPGE